MEILIAAVSDALQPGVILYTIFGVFLGCTVGAIPGLSGDMAIAMLLPLVYKMSPGTSIGLLLGIYKASMFGGAISAVSFGVPGTPPAAVTLIDGYPAKLKGYPNRALKTALYSSVTGDFFSSLILVSCALPLAAVAIKFGPVEFFALYVFSLAMISLLTMGTVGKGLAAGAIGLFIGVIGMDPAVGAPRYLFGLQALRSGIPLIPLLIGTLALPELIIQFSKEWKKLVERRLSEMAGQDESQGYDPSKDRYTFKVYLSTLKATTVGSLAGAYIGALPGAGSTLAAFLSYGLAKRFSKHPEEFGKGSLEGVAGPEAADSATCGASMIPLFAFGIPGSATAALFGAALIMQGINPGPTMFEENTLIMYTLFVIILYASAINLFLCRFLIPVYARLSMIKGKYLIPAVFAMAILGTYSARNSVIDVFMLLGAGILGTTLRIYGFPLGPLVLGYLIGPGTERSLSQALLIGKKNWSFLLQSPVAIGFYVATLGFLLYVWISGERKKTVSKMEESNMEED